MYSVGNFWMKIKTWFISKNCLFLFWKSVYFLVKNKPIFRINKISFKSHQYSNHSWLIFILTIDLVNIPPVFQRAKIEKEYSLSLVVLNWRLNSYKKPPTNSCLKLSRFGTSNVLLFIIRQHVDKSLPNI